MGSDVAHHVRPVEEGADAEVRVHFKTIITVVAINFLNMAQLVSIVGSGLLAQQMGQLFHGTTNTVWFSALLTILTLALNTPASQAADYWGRKWLIAIPSCGGIIGPLIISRAENFATAIVGFVFLGASFACQSTLFAVLSEILPRKYRPIAQAFGTQSGGVAAIVALLMGGALLRHDDLENLRVFWYVATAIYATGLLGVLFTYYPPPRELQVSLTLSEKLRRLDWLGYFLSTSGLILFCIALSWSENPYGWGDAHILATFILGVVILIAFGIYEWRFRVDGLLDHKLFQHRNFPLGLLAFFIEGAAFFTTNTYLAFEVSVLYNEDLFISAVNFVITFVAAIVISGIVGAYSSWRKTIRETLLVGFASLLIFNALMASVKPSTPRANVWAYPIFSGAGLGVLLTNITVAIQFATPGDMISVASGLAISTRSFGAAVGLVVNNAIFNSAMSKNLPTKVAAAIVPLGFNPQNLGAFLGALDTKDPMIIAQVPGTNPQIISAGLAAMKEAYSISFRNAWIAATSFCVVGVIACFFFKESRKDFNNHIDAPVESGLVELQKRIEANEQHSQYVEKVEPHDP